MSENGGCLRVRKPSAILFDLLGTVTKANFAEQVLLPYVKSNCAEFLDTKWNTPALQQDIREFQQRIKPQANTKTGSAAAEEADKNNDEQAAAKQLKQALVETICKSIGNIDGNSDHDDDIALDNFKLHILSDGYSRDRLETAVYADVAITVRSWAVDEHVPLYAICDDQRLAKVLLAHTNVGDMTPLIRGYFDRHDSGSVSAAAAAVAGAKNKYSSLTDTANYQRILVTLKLAPDDVLLLTPSGFAGRAAKCAGLGVVLLLQHRRDLARLADEDRRAIPHVRSLHKLIFDSDPSVPKAAQLDGRFAG